MADTLAVRDFMKLESIFIPWSWQARCTFYGDPKEGENPSAKFVHYTSAEAALGIIKSKRIRMRNTTCMSDYREVLHGYDYLFDFFSDKLRKDPLLEALDAARSATSK